MTDAQVHSFLSKLNIWPGALPVGLSWLSIIPPGGRRLDSQSGNMPSRRVQEAVD